MAILGEFSQRIAERPKHENREIRCGKDYAEGVEQP